MATLSNKYQVRPIIEETETHQRLGERFPQEEFIVLRKQDALASAALWAYVGVLRTAAETLRLAGFPEAEEYERLLSMADGFSERARDWEAAFRKLPD